MKENSMKENSEYDEWIPMYMADSTAPEEDPYERRRKEKIRRETEQSELRKRTKAYAKRKPPYDFGQFLPILFIVVVFTILSVILLYQENQIMKIKNTIKKKEAEYQQILQDNKAYTTKIDRSLDINQIYEKATEELGMVYPNEGQIIVYNKKESGYVRQYEEINNK